MMRPLMAGVALLLAASAMPAFDDDKPDTSTLKPLTDMTRDDDYHGFKGGLYPNGSNQRPAGHEKLGLELAKRIEPLDAAGKPAADGKIVLLGIGFSNTNQCMTGFIDVARGDNGLNPKVAIVNGAQGGRSAFMIQNPDDKGVGEAYWKTWVIGKLKDRDVTAAQVQAIWLKETDASLSPMMLKNLGVENYDNPLRMGFPKGAQTLQAELKKIVQALPRLFPNVKVAYLSSRSYGGWAKREGNKEPWSFETGFAVKWLIEEQIKGDAGLNCDPSKGGVKAPWLSWGPYWWANGDAKRKDGFAFEPGDFREDDRMHHSPQGMKKMGNQLLQFFKTDATTKNWFLNQ